MPKFTKYNKKISNKRATKKCFFGGCKNITVNSVIKHNIKLSTTQIEDLIDNDALQYTDTTNFSKQLKTFILTKPILENFKETGDLIDIFKENESLETGLRAFFKIYNCNKNRAIKELLYLVADNP